MPPVLTLPYLLQEARLKQADLTRAKQLIDAALTRGEDILVYGDYDADGLTATSIMWLTLIGLAKGTKARILPFVPDRHRHGYGLSSLSLADIKSGRAFVDTAYPDFHPSLLITVDNGIVANEAVRELESQGVRVIITDHHVPSESLPPSSCIIHSTITSGAGLSWIVALFLSHSHPAILGLVGLATIGIVADQMPLTGLNRAVVIAGLANLTESRQEGILALKAAAGMSGRAVTTYDINFGLAPRLNAAGRLSTPLDGLRLLCTSNKAQATTLALSIESLNKKRQELTETMISDALTKPVRHKLIMLSSRDYHEGVIGLVAGKLAEHHHRPAIVIAKTDSLCKGSARSVKGVNITALLRKHASLFTSLGGHDQAAGFSLPSSNLAKLEAALYHDADLEIDDKLLVKEYHADLALPLRSCTLELARLLKQLEPYGLGNPKPSFVTTNLAVLSSRSLKNGQHHKLALEQGGVTRDLLWFNSPGLGELSSIQELLFSLDINVWVERETVQLTHHYART